MRDERLVSFSKIRDSGDLFYDGFRCDVQSGRVRPAEVSLCVAAQDFVHLLVRAPQQLIKCARRFNTIALRFLELFRETVKNEALTPDAFPREHPLLSNFLGEAPELRDSRVRAYPGELLLRFYARKVRRHFQSRTCSYDLARTADPMFYLCEHLGGLGMLNMGPSDGGLPEIANYLAPYSAIRDNFEEMLQDMTPIADYEDTTRDVGQPQCFDQNTFFVNSS